MTELRKEWYRIKKECKVKRNTECAYSSIMKRIDTAIGDMKVKDVTIDNNGKPLNSINTEYLFLNRNENLMAVKSINHFFNQIKRKVGLGEDLSTHCFRYNFISECYTAGVDIKKLQLWVGHVDIGTTLNIYSKLSREVINDGNEMNHFYGSQTEVKPVKR